mmetsp:Transcript_25441/g.75188  ORF Transcript_25441/g.75188 Transcript_25441/m.75188 type:complete len:95 (+) Transcript_25441:2142-2426(+)
MFALLLALPSYALLRRSFHALQANFTYRTVGLRRPLSSMRVVDFFGAVTRADVGEEAFHTVADAGLLGSNVPMTADRLTRRDRLWALHAMGHTW